MWVLPMGADICVRRIQTIVLPTELRPESGVESALVIGTKNELEQQHRISNDEEEGK